VEITDKPVPMADRPAFWDKAIAQMPEFKSIHEFLEYGKAPIVDGVGYSFFNQDMFKTVIMALIHTLEINGVISIEHMLNGMCKKSLIEVYSMYKEIDEKRAKESGTPV
jgi:hypothetical protein